MATKLLLKAAGLTLITLLLFKAGELLMSPWDVHLPLGELSYNILPNLNLNLNPSDSGYFHLHKEASTLYGPEACYFSWDF